MVFQFYVLTERQDWVPCRTNLHSHKFYHLFWVSYALELNLNQMLCTECIDVISSGGAHKVDSQKPTAVLSCPPGLQ